MAPGYHPKPPPHPKPSPSFGPKPPPRGVSIPPPPPIGYPELATSGEYDQHPASPSTLLGDH